MRRERAAPLHRPRDRAGAGLGRGRTDSDRLGGRSVDAENLPVWKPAGPLDGATAWFNSPPLGQSDLAGKVVMYDFWTYSCVNCVRTLPYLRAWHDRYAWDGAVIVGVHSPEFDFEYVRGNVDAAIRRLNVTWPVALDNDKTIWDTFKNNYWPAKYVADRDGKIRYKHIGEGGYQETEDVLRSLLGVDSASPRLRRPGAATRPTPLQTRSRPRPTSAQRAALPAPVGGWSPIPSRDRSPSASAGWSAGGEPRSRR